MPLYFGMFVSVAAYLVGMALKKKLGWAILNPLLVAILLVMAFLKATGISYGEYSEGASYASRRRRRSSRRLGLWFGRCFRRELSGLGALRLRHRFCFGR